MPPSVFFPREVQEQLGYYVYRLVDPSDGVAFYVGKGQGDRVFQHKAGMAELPEEADVSPVVLNEKLRSLNEIQATGLDVMSIIHRHGLSERTAFEVEAALIDAYLRLVPEEDANAERFGFLGESAPMAVERLYLNKRVPLRYRRRGVLVWCAC